MNNFKMPEWGQNLSDKAQDVFDAILDNIEYIIIGFLVALMFFFIKCVWFGEGYALPTRSVSWLGFVLCIVLWVVYATRTDRLPRGSKANSPKYKVWMATAITILHLAYVVVPTMARSYVNDQGRYWMIARVFSDEWELQKPSSFLGGDKYPPYPRWSFIQKAKDPFSLPGQEVGYGGFVWEGQTTTTTTAVEGFQLTINTHYKATATENEVSILVLKDNGLSTEMIEERISKEFIPSVIARIVTVSEQCKLDLETEVVTGFRPVRPLRDDIVFTGESFQCTYKLKPIVL